MNKEVRELEMADLRLSKNAVDVSFEELQVGDHIVAIRSGEAIIDEVDVIDDEWATTRHYAVEISATSGYRLWRLNSVS
ncbi:hypothetical protein MUN77_03435 [Leucobacter allii]|uniref:hypothetical protein n=1 Tax=Leucobacter allii TaxID=2932247 RepID=UPI001FD5829D|nr:hypothetical protein [Leucobacter allii]UOR02383.1 hypothetical protein MUN77_03435 [Leucobacter allii]